MAEGRQPRRVLLFGPPGSGKGTQAARLAEYLGVPAVSTGEMLRRAVREGSELGDRVTEILGRGELVDDETMAGVVEERLGRADAVGGFLLDGYPRTMPQAGRLDLILAQQGVRLDAVILLDVGTEELVRRLVARGRDDDREQVVRERLRIYRERTAPLEAAYRERGILRVVPGDQTIDEVAEGIRSALEAG